MNEKKEEAVGFIGNVICKDIVNRKDHNNEYSVIHSKRGFYYSVSLTVI